MCVLFYNVQQGQDGHLHTLRPQTHFAPSVKYLGVHINKQLNWNTHVNYTAAKANNSLNFLRRNINVSNPKIKEKAYKSLVRPIHNTHK